MAFQITKGLPLDPEARCSYPFAQMEVGDAFDAPRNLGLNHKYEDKRRIRITDALRYFRRTKQPTWRFSVRCIDRDTVRCQRIV